MAGRLEAGARRAVAGLDAVLNRVYGWRYNPVHQSGAAVVLLLLVTLVTGLYLLLFYRIGAPYESVARITEQTWGGRWIRGLHRYASDALVVFAVLHAFRMFAQGRHWGPRALAWVSGWVLLLAIYVIGWTGYVMVWDMPAQVLAVEGARLLDLLPLFSEPLGRAFVGERPLPTAFFFLNLFLHILLPIGLGLLFWIHVSRVARARMLPPRPVTLGILGVLLALSVLWPIGMAPAADLFRLPERIPMDFFYAFWLPMTGALPAAAVWALGGVAAALLVLVPWLLRPEETERPEASAVNERLCTGCEQCVLDCPYEAISLVERDAEAGSVPEWEGGRGSGARDGSRSRLVARVNPALCVSCGICAASCAPMGVGPPGRTGRDQLTAMRSFMAERLPHTGEVVVVMCERSWGGPTAVLEVPGTFFYPVTCAGNVHTSVLEAALRAGAGGVAVVACPPRDCWSREGPVWTEERLYHDREAELQERVDRRRVRLIVAGAGRMAAVAAELTEFRDRIRALAGLPPGLEGDLVAACRAVEAREAS